MTHTLYPHCEEPPASPVDSGGQTLSTLEKLCGRKRALENGDGPLGSLATAQPNWSALLGAAGDHSVGPLVCKRLLELPGAATLPTNWRDRFREEFIGSAHRNLLLTAELIRVLRRFEDRGLQAVPFKGPVLAQQAYGDLALRQFSDLDIVLPHAQMPEAHRALEGLGYSSGSAAAAMAERRIPGQYAYRSDAHKILVELHTERTMRYLPVPLNWSALGSRLETISIGGQRLRTFSVEDTLVLICVHGTKHFWTRLGWICDVAELVQAPRGIDWQRTEILAREMRCRRMWLLGLALASEVLAAPLPAAVAGQIHADARLAALARRVQECFLRQGESRISAKERLWFRSNTQDTLATRLRQLRIFATRPADADWQSRALPRWAAPLYAILRPLRILRDYGFGRS